MENSSFNFESACCESVPFVLIDVAVCTKQCPLPVESVCLVDRCGSLHQTVSTTC